MGRDYSGLILSFAHETKQTLQNWITAKRANVRVSGHCDCWDQRSAISWALGQSIFTDSSVGLPVWHMDPFDAS